MERNSRAKRSGSPPRKERKDSVKARGGGRQTAGSSVKKSVSSASKSPSSTANSTDPSRSVLGIKLNAETARQAMILSEIIGKPVSKRGRRR